MKRSAGIRHAPWTTAATALLAVGLLAAVASTASCSTVAEADVDNSPFLNLDVPLSLPVDAAPRLLEIERSVWLSRGDDASGRRTASLRLVATESTAENGARTWTGASFVQTPKTQTPETQHPDTSPTRLPDLRFDADGTARPTPEVSPAVALLIAQESERAATAWEDDVLFPDGNVSSGESWVLDPTAVLATAAAGPLRGMQVLDERSSGYAHSSALLPYTNAVVWSVEAHLRLAPTSLPDPVFALWTELLGDEVRQLAEIPPNESTASIQLTQRSTFPEPDPARTRRDETVELTVRWTVDGETVELGLVEKRVRAHAGVE